MRLRNPSGFTLVELIAAVGLALVTVMLGGLLERQAQDIGARIESAGADMAREGNGQRQLRDLLSQAEPSADSTRHFRGDARFMEYQTWCETPRGYPIRCTAAVSIDSVGDSSIVTVQMNDGATLAVRRRAGRSEFRYLDAGHSDTAWREYWQTGTTLPLAIALVSPSDTVVYPVGPSRD